jgi:hypothetical protein
MSDENEFSIEELELLSRWLKARLAHINDLPTANITPTLRDYAQFLMLELNFVTTVLEDKKEGAETPAEQLELPL